MLKPLNKRALCRVVDTAKKSIIVIHEDKYPVIFDVLSVSDDIDSGILKIGDRILTEKYYGQDVTVDGENLVIIQLDKIVGVFCDA